MVVVDALSVKIALHNIVIREPISDHLRRFFSVDGCSREGHERKARKGGGTTSADLKRLARPRGFYEGARPNNLSTDLSDHYHQDGHGQHHQAREQGERVPEQEQLLSLRQLPRE